MNGREEALRLRIHGGAALPTLIYLPGLHGDWTLVSSFRAAVANHVRFVEMTYPRSLDWSIPQLASAIRNGLLEHRIQRGWLLGESFGSQCAWEMIRENPGHDGFMADGLILAGGFVKHPWNWGPCLLRRIGATISTAQYRRMLKVYAAYARFRHRRAPEIFDSINEFVARRTELDREAMRHRLNCLDDYDPSRIAEKTRIPVYYIAGAFDPLVPWALVRRWLRRNCPGYRGGKTVWLADHNVLATAPGISANLALKWMGCARPERL